MKSLAQHLNRVAAYSLGLARNTRLRGELGWVLGAKVGEFLLFLVLLKVLTTSLGKDGYGEYNLVETSLILIAAALLSPVSESFLRELHQSRKRGDTRHAGFFVLRWYSAITVGVAMLGFLAAFGLADTFAVAPSTIVAAGLAFFADRWRILGLEVLSMRRQRRRWALSSLVYGATLVATMSTTFFWFTPTPSAAIYTYAATAAIFAGLVTGPMIAEIMASPAGPKSNIGSMAVAFGIPFGLLLLLQWIQGFADRFLIKGLLEDAAAVGLYAAAYQICGAPFTLLFRTTQHLLRPVAYQKGDSRNLSTLWSADRILLAGIAVQIVCGTLAGIFLVWLGPRIIVLLTNSTFQIDRLTIAALTVGRFAQMIGASVQPIFAIHHAMGRLLYFRLTGAVLTIALCYPLTVHYGIIGTAVGTALALTSYLVVLLVAPKGALSLLIAARRAAASTPVVTDDHRLPGNPSV